jgi:signal peptidase II
MSILSNVSRLRNRIAIAAVAALVLVLDQFSKAWVVQNLALGASWVPVPVLANIFKITHSANSGAAFSIFQGANFPLLALSLVMAVAILLYLRQVPAHQSLIRLTLAVLLGGVLGNALDRIRLGTVIDFIHWQIPNVVSNVYNLADHAIVLSVIVLFLIQFRTARTPEKSSSEAPPGL